MYQPITLQTFRYYVLAEALPVPPDQFSPLKFAPYIDFCYGRAQEIIIGSVTQASSEASLKPTLDLSLSLVQVARCLSYQYDSCTASSMEAARSWVQTCLTGRDLDHLLPGDFVELFTVVSSTPLRPRRFLASLRRTKRLRTLSY